MKQSKPSGLWGRLTHSKSYRKLQAEPSKWENMTFPTNPDDYELQAECGRGGAATVYQGICKPNGEKVAIKKIPLDDRSDWEDVINEARTMALHHHPNLLPLLASFTDGNQLWIVVPYIDHGSVQNILKYKYRDGLTEDLIAIVIHETLRGLEYLHHHGMMHRDVKAGNVLVDSDGHVYLADFGVAAPLENRGGSWSDKPRNTFVGTPCWMAPEVMQESLYDMSADIWSLGITVVELAHGHAPFAKYPPFKVVMMTVQNPPPSLNSEPNKKKKHFSQDLHDLVALCLQKDPVKRPTARDLLEHRFFRHVKDKEYMKKHLIKGLPDVIERVRQMREGVAGLSCEAACSAEATSNQEYVKGLSAWNFDVKELRRQAAQMEPLLEEDEHLDKTSGLSFTSSREDLFLTPAATPAGTSPLTSSSSNALPTAPSPGALAIGTSSTSLGINDAAVLAGVASGSTSAAGSGASPQDTNRSDTALPPGAAGSGGTSRDPSNMNDAVLGAVSSTMSSQPLFPHTSEQGMVQPLPAVAATAPIVHVPAVPPSPPSVAASAPPSNPPSEAIEDDFAQATIGPAIAQINTYMPPLHCSLQGAYAAPTRSGTQDSVASAPLHGVPNVQPALLATQSSGISAAAATAAAVSVGEAALPPTEVNVAQHTLALEAAEVGVAAPTQKVGRFSIKKRPGTSDNGSAQTGGVCEEALHRISQGTSVAHTDIGKQGVLDDSGLESMMCREDATARSKSKKGRFNVTTPAGATAGPLHRTSLSTSALVQEADRDLNMEALTALDTDPVHTGRPSDLDHTARSVHEAPCISPAHTASTHGEIEPSAAAQASAAAACAVAMVTVDSSALEMSASTATTPAGAAAINSAVGKDVRKSRFKVVKVVESVKGAEIGPGPSHPRPSTETAPPAPGSTPGGVYTSATTGFNGDALAVVNLKLQELAHASQMQQEAIRMLMSAVSEFSKGRDAQITDLGRNPLLAMHLMGSETQQNALLEENAQLKAELEELRKKNKKQSDQAKQAFQKEKELHRTQVHSLKDRINKLEVGGHRATSTELASSVPLGVPVGDSRASSPSAPHVPPPTLPDMAATAPIVPSRPLPLDMSMLADGASTTTLSTAGIQEFADDGPWCAPPSTTAAPTPAAAGASSFSLSDLAHASIPFGAGAAGSSASLRHSQSAFQIGRPVGTPACAVAATVNPFTGTAAAQMHPPSTSAQVFTTPQHPVHPDQGVVNAQYAAKFLDSPQAQQLLHEGAAGPSSISPAGGNLATHVADGTCTTPDRAVAASMKDAVSMPQDAEAHAYGLSYSSMQQPQPVGPLGTNPSAVWLAQEGPVQVWPAQQASQCASAAAQSTSLVTTPANATPPIEPPASSLASTGATSVSTAIIPLPRTAACSSTSDVSSALLTQHPRQVTSPGQIDSQHRLDKQVSQISAASGSSTSGYLPSFPTCNTSFAHQVAVSSTNAHAAYTQAAERAASNCSRVPQTSNVDHVRTCMDALADDEVGSSTGMHVPTAEPFVEEDAVGYGDVDTTSKSLQLAQEMSDLPHPPCPQHEYPVVPDTMLPSSAFTSMSVDNLACLAGSSQEVSASAFAGVSSSAPVSRQTEVEHQSLSGERVASGEEEITSPALDAMEHAECEVPGKQELWSPYSTSRHTWVTAPERSMTSSTCGGTPAEQEALTTPETVSTLQWSRHAFSPVPAFSAMSAMSTPKDADAQPITFPGTNPPTLLKPVEDDSNEDSSLLSAGLPGRICADSKGVGQTCSAAVSDLSRMSAARSQFGLLQGQRTPGGDYPVSPSSCGSSASPRVSSITPEKFQQGLTAAKLSSGTDQQVSPNSRRGSEISTSSTKNALYQLSHQRSLQSQIVAASGARSGKSKRITSDSQPAAGVWHRARRLLKRALSRSFHTVKSLTVSGSTTVTRTDTHNTDAPAREVKRQPLLRRSFIPKSSLFKSIQDSIMSITDDEAEHEHAQSSAARSLDSYRGEVGDVVAAVGHSPLQACATPSGAHVVHQSDDMEPPVSGPMGLHTPHSCTASAQSGPQLLPPSPAALVGSQLSESVSSQGHSMNDASPGKFGASHGSHTVDQVAPGVVSVGHTQDATELLGRPEDVESSKTRLRHKHRPLSNSHVGERPTLRDGVYQSLRRRSALAACFCGMLDSHHHVGGEGHGTEKSEDH